MRFINKLVRGLDLIFVFSKRAQWAQMAASVAGVSMETMYDGGLHVHAEHLLPEFKSGTPSFNTHTNMRVARLGECGELTETRALYEPASDTFRSEGISRPREPDDLWLPDSDYEDAFRRAAQRAAVGRSSNHR